MPEALSTQSDPAARHWLIEPSDDTDQAMLTRGIYCKEDGTIVVRDKDGRDLPYPMTAGDSIPVRAVRVLDTGTSGVFYGWD